MPTIKHKIVGVVSFQNLGDGKLRLLNNWEAENIVTVKIPQLVGVNIGGGQKSSGNVRWYKGGVYQLQQAFQEVEDRGLKGKILTYAGSFVPRMIRGSVSTPSEHSFGTAFDINVAWNGLGHEPAAAGTTGSVRELVPIFERWGFRWGGNFSRRDGMHMEIARLIQKPITSTPEKTISNERQLFINDIQIKDAYMVNNRWVGEVSSAFAAAGLALQTDVEETTPQKHFLRVNKAK